MHTDGRPHTWWPLPPRSGTDRKLGGVAGGLGRAWNIDPILIRVAFVVLTLFGGSGVLLYCAGWLAMRGDGDNASAIEALAGRGKSSVSPALTIVLIVVALGSMGSVFSWGLPFWPVVVGAVIVAVVMGHRRRSETADREKCTGQWADDVANRIAKWGDGLGEQVGTWFDRSSGTASPRSADKQRPVAGDAETDETSEGAGPDREPGAGDGSDALPADPEPDDLLSAGRTPPAWDPLGAAPFAWDLPEPSPTPGSAAAETAEGDGRSRRSVIGRVFLGLALIVGSVAAAGVAAQWWRLPWSAVAGITLSVLAVGLAISALRGRGSRVLIGPGVFLAVLTLALSVSGLKGTSGFGSQHWLPASAADVAPSYSWNAGDVTLDLSTIAIPKGETVHTDLTVGVGRATVIVPPDVAVYAECSATAGNIDCLGQRADGLRPQLLVNRTPGNGTSVLPIPPTPPAPPAITADQPVETSSTANSAGTLALTIHSNAGQVVLTSHE